MRKILLDIEKAYPNLMIKLNPDIKEVDCLVSVNSFYDERSLMRSCEIGVPIICPPNSSIIEAREEMPELIKFVNPNSLRSIINALNDVTSSEKSHMISAEVCNIRHLAIQAGMQRAKRRRSAWKSKFLKI